MATSSGSAALHTLPAPSLLSLRTYCNMVEDDGEAHGGVRWALGTPRRARSQGGVSGDACARGRACLRTCLRVSDVHVRPPSDRHMLHDSVRCSFARLALFVMVPLLSCRVPFRPRGSRLSVVSVCRFRVRGCAFVWVEDERVSTIVDPPDPLWIDRRRDPGLLKQILRIPFVPRESAPLIPCNPFR